MYSLKGVMEMEKKEKSVNLDTFVYLNMVAGEGFEPPTPWV